MRWALNAGGDITHLSHEWSRLARIHPDDVQGKAYHEVIHRDDVALVRQIVDPAIERAAPFMLTCRLRNPLDHHCWIIASGTPALSQIDGDFLGYLGSAEPISPPVPPRVVDILNLEASGAEGEGVVKLDAVAYHLLEARKSAAGLSNDDALQKLLDIVLTEVAYRLARLAA